MVARLKCESADKPSPERKSARMPPRVVRTFDDNELFDGEEDDENIGIELGPCWKREHPS